jgi:penicillin-binding protein 2
MKGNSLDLRNMRARFARIFLLLAFAVLIFRAFLLQGFKSAEYSLKSDQNRLKEITIPAPRGLILDRDGHLLADNIPSYSLYLNPSREGSPAETMVRLDEVLRLGEKRRNELETRLSQRSFRPIKVVDNMDITIRSFLEEHRALIPGLLVRSEPLRYYQFGRELSHVIGYVGEINPSDQNRRGDRMMSGWGFVGRDGLESVYEESLRGRPGSYLMEVDARGMEIAIFQGREPIRPERGTDITLTIDLDLQLEANRLFPTDYHGAVLCLDPRNGEILAMVSQPDFDPNALVSGISSERWKEMIDDPGSPLFNRVTQAGYPPGSTFKLAVALIALERKMVDIRFREPVPCFGGMWYGTRWFGCWKEQGHGSLDLYQAIVQSCDTYFYQLGNRLGVDALLEGAKDLGFSKKTGIDLPNESRGFVPDPTWYDRRYGERGWGRGVALNLAIGQGELLLTPLQLAVFYSMLANGGRFVRPHLIPEIDGEEPVSVEPFPPEFLSPLLDALASVVRDERGTARYAGATVGIDMAGKTGTAQNPHGEDHSIFVGYAPPEEPEILAVAIIEGAGHGSTVAAPLVGRLLKRRLEDLGLGGDFMGETGG